VTHAYSKTCRMTVLRAKGTRVHLKNDPLAVSTSPRSESVDLGFRRARLLDLPFQRLRWQTGLVRTHTRFMCRALIGFLFLASPAAMSSDVAGLVEKTPLTYVSGRNQIPSGLEKALVGLHVGEEKDVRLSPEEGFGPVRSDARQEVPKNAVPPESQKVGAILQAHSADQTKIVSVVEVKENTIVIDFNHPYAGKTVTFHVKVIGVKKVVE